VPSKVHHVSEAVSAFTGNLRPVSHDRGRRQTTRTPDLEEEVLERVTEHPSSSTRALAQEVGVDRTTVWRVLFEQLHPYHLQKVQDLHPTYFAPCVVFSKMLVHRCLQEPQFLAVILFTDEACFTREGVFNTRNSHMWADANPHGTIVHEHQQ